MDAHDESQLKRRAAADPTRAAMHELHKALRAEPDAELAAEARALLARWEQHRLAQKEAAAAERQARLAQAQGSPALPDVQDTDDGEAR